MPGSLIPTGLEPYKTQTGKAGQQKRADQTPGRTIHGPCFGGGFLMPLNRNGDAELRLLTFLPEVGNIRAAFVSSKFRLGQVHHFGEQNP